MLAGVNAALKDNRIVFDGGVLLHHDRIRATRQGRARHDLHACARFHLSCKGVPRAAFSD